MKATTPQGKFSYEELMEVRRTLQGGLFPQCDFELAAAGYFGDVDPEQERACIARVRERARGRPMLRLPSYPASLVPGTKYLEDGVRIVRYVSPYNGQWFNEVQVAFKQPEAPQS